MRWNSPFVVGPLLGLGLGLVALCLLSDTITSWLCPSFFALVVVTVVYWSAWALFESLTEGSPESDRSTEFVASMVLHYRHGDDLLHQRIGFWMVAEAALIGAVAQAIEHRRAVAMIAIFGLVFTVIASLNVWIIHRRVRAALRHVIAGDAAYQTFIQTVPKKLSWGGVSMAVWMPYGFVLLWVIVFAGALADVWRVK